MGEMFNNPDFMNMAMNMMKQPGMQNVMKNVLQNMGGGELLNKIDDKVFDELKEYEEYKNSEKIQKVVSEIKENGITALMTYIGDNEIQQFFMNFAKDKSSNGGENPFANIFGKANNSNETKKDEKDDKNDKNDFEA